MNKPSEAIDRRVRKTKQQIKKGFVKLLSEKELHDITVKELTDMVDINRGTFYLHYKDIYDLLSHIEDEMMNELNALLDKHMVTNPTSLSNRFFIEVLQYVKQNAQLCLFFLKKKGDDHFYGRLKKMLEGRCTNYLVALNKNVELRSYEFFSAYVVTGTIGLIQQWLETGHRESIETIASLLTEIDDYTSIVNLNRLEAYMTQPLPISTKK